MTVTNSLTAMYVGVYNNDPKMLQHIIDSQASKIIMLQTYRMLVKENSLQEIHDIPISDKIKLVDECKLTGLKFNNERLIQACQILHTLKFINENS